MSPQPRASRAKAKEKDEEPQAPPPTTGSGPELLDAETYTQLRRPFTAAAIKWKVQVNPKALDKAAVVVGYIDARLVQERLNAVVPGRWESTFLAPINPGDTGDAVRCRLKVCGVTREDVGLYPGGEKEVKIKGGYSDSLKRAGVQFGIGVSIYALPKMFLTTRDGVETWLNEKDNKVKAKLTEVAERGLRERYQRWLTEVGVKHFGEPMDHGDAEDAQGDVEVEHSDVAPEPAPPVTASDDLKATTVKAVAYLEQFSGVDGDSYLVPLMDHYEGLPEPAARAIISFARLVREKAAAAEAAAETNQ